MARGLDGLNLIGIERRPSAPIVDRQEVARHLAEANAVGHALRQARRDRAIADHNAARERATQAIKNTPSRPNQVRVSDYGSLASPNKALRQVKEPDIKRSPEKVRDGPTCKERPKQNRGNGGSRHFVPWCGRKS